MDQPRHFKDTCNFISSIIQVNGMAVVTLKKKLIWIKLLRSSIMIWEIKKRMKRKKIKNKKLLKMEKNQRKV